MTFLNETFMNSPVPFLTGRLALILLTN